MELVEAVQLLCLHEADPLPRFTPMLSPGRDSAPLSSWTCHPRHGDGPGQSQPGLAKSPLAPGPRAWSLSRSREVLIPIDWFYLINE